MGITLPQHAPTVVLCSLTLGLVSGQPITSTATSTTAVDLSSLEVWRFDGELTCATNGRYSTDTTTRNDFLPPFTDPETRFDRIRDSESWLSFEAPADGMYTFSTCAAEFDSRVQIFEMVGDIHVGAAVASCDDCGPCGIYATLAVNLTEGTYWVVVDASPKADPREASRRGDRFTVTLECPIGARIEGELQCDAPVIGSISFPDNPRSLFGEGGASDLYTFEAAFDGWYTFSTCSNETTQSTTLLLFREGGPDELEWEKVTECDDCGHRCPEGRFHAVLSTPLAAGRYAIGVAAFIDDVTIGLYRLEVTSCPTANEEIAPPSDDVLTCGGAVTGNTEGGVSLVVRNGGLDSGNSVTTNYSGPERWIEFTAPVTGVYTFDTCGSSFNTQLQLFRRVPGSNHRGDIVAQADRSATECADYTAASLRTVELEGGATFWVVVDGADNRAGQFVLSVSCPTIGCGEVVHGTTVGGTTISARSPAAERIIAFTATTTGYHVFSTCAGDPVDHFALSIYTQITGDFASDAAALTAGSLEHGGDVCSTETDRPGRVDAPQCRPCVAAGISPAGAVSQSHFGSLLPFLQEGQQYLIVIERVGDAAGPFTLSALCPSTDAPTTPPTTRAPTRNPTPNPTPQPTPQPTPPPTPSPPPPLAADEEESCLSGDALVERVGGGSLGSATATTSAVQVRDLAPGDVVRGASGDALRPAFCTVEAVGGFGYGTVYGDYTDHHYLIDSATKTVVPAGTRDHAPSVVDKYIVLLGGSVDAPSEECYAGMDMNANLYTPIDTDFCGSDVPLSFSDYKLIYSFIVRTVRASGGFWLQRSSYTARSVPQPDGSTRVLKWHEGTPQLCRSMLACAASADVSSEACAEYEAVGADFVGGFMTPAAQQATHQAFPHLGEPGVTGSASYAAMNGGSNDDTPWHIAVGVLAAALVVIAAVVAAAWRYTRSRRRDPETALFHDDVGSGEMVFPTGQPIEVETFELYAV
eukprot:CAMPEP_0206311872 /NCGR_PEP_ID=MMETSP0106_2-20121207/13693_1 /ASSEMBLY_ACC=CAM_ASM_000206 /TAXON_ID=81532 /ORGANISM="Acanthoeca-like sp., Strain 10tr" /LENGTH=981 /DNA_ID=CAMNT_0053743145 /DNA_START=151 /DNA_END=3096 /DNA_ORIENTATION=+